MLSDVKLEEVINGYEEIYQSTENPDYKSLSLDIKESLEELKRLRIMNNIFKGILLYDPEVARLQAYDKGQEDIKNKIQEVLQSGNLNDSECCIEISKIVGIYDYKKSNVNYFRDATKDEMKSVKEYIESISTYTGINIWNDEQERVKIYDAYRNKGFKEGCKKIRDDIATIYRTHIGMYSDEEVLYKIAEYIGIEMMN